MDGRCRLCLRIRTNNALGYVDVGPFHYYHRVDASGPEEGLSLWFNTDDECKVPIFAVNEIGFYEIYAAGQRVLSETLRSNESSRSLPNTNGVIHRMLTGDSTVRITLGDAYFDWRISASQLARAIERAQGLLYQVQQDYSRGACQPASSEPCLLTTVACREIGLADDCAELKAVRRLRDGWLVNQPFGPVALAWYRVSSRAILDAISARDRRRVFARFYMLRLVPAVIAEKLGFHRWAFMWLRRGVEALHAHYVLAPRVSAETAGPKTP